MIDINDINGRFFKIPEPSVKPRWEQEHKEITVHTQRKSPGKLLTKRRPTESLETHEYRIANFEHITNGPFNRAVERLQEILTEGNVTINMPDALSRYLSELTIGNLKFWQWLNSKVCRRMIDDPNGLLVYWPIGEGLSDATKPVGVQPLLILCKQIRHKTDDFISWLSQEKNPIRLANGEVVQGDIFYLADDTNFYKYKQVDAGGISRYKLEIHYPHKLGKIPVITLGGDQLSDEKTDELFYTSFFHGAVPYANEAIKNYSDHQASVITSAHPIREMESTKCTHKGCEGGKIKEKGVGVQQWQTCPSCKGSGEAKPLSPYGVLLRPKGRSINGDEVKRTDAIKYHVLPPENLEYQEKHWRNFLADAEKALNLLRVEDSQSGVAKEIDREGIRAMIDKIGFHWYNHIVKQSIDFIGNMVFLSKPANTTIIIPKTLKPKTEEELAEEVTHLKEKGAPSFLIQMAVHTLVKSRYSSDKVALRMSEFLLAYDPLFPFTTDEKSVMTAGGAAETEMFSYSSLAPSLLFQVLLEIGEAAFLNISFEQLKAKVDAKFQLVKPKTSSIFNDNGNRIM